MNFEKNKGRNTNKVDSKKIFKKALTANRRCANITASDSESEVDKMKMILLIKSNVILSGC